MMDLVEQLKQDYAKFPEDQSYDLYAENVHFKDPLNEFDGVNKYQAMIGFLGWFFRDVQMDLHHIERASPQLITMDWTLNMTPPVPWSPRLSIPGNTELSVNEAGLINSHIDYWKCSRLDVLKQVFS